MRNPIIIIGSGLGGLSAGISLASKGYQVKIIEKNEKPGGKMDEIQSNGFRFDTGPSLLTMKFVLEKLFLEAERKIEDYLEIIPIDPICRYFFADGTQLDAHSDLEEMCQKLPQQLQSERTAIQNYLTYSKNIYDLTTELFLFERIQSIAHISNPKAWKTLFNLKRIDPFRTVHQANKSFFKSKHLIQLFDRYATYNGSDPYQAPATLNIIPHVEYTLGSWYIKGGMYRLAEALTKLASELGVEFQYNTSIKEICVENKQVTGVLCTEGTKYNSSTVLSNADVVYTHTQLLKDFPKQAKQWENKEPSCSGLVFLWGINKTHPQLSHHNILFSENYEREFNEIFKELIPPSDPTVYISITSKTDTTHAPQGKENWFVLINMPWLKDGAENTEKEINAIREAVFKRIEKAGIGKIQNHIEHEQILSPSYLRSRTFSNKGSIYGLSSNHRNAAFYRQDNRSRLVNGLYFAGGSAHPGGGIPLVILSGINAARLIQKQKG